MIFRAIIAAVLVAMVSACSLAALSHDPETVFTDPEAYEAQDRAAELVRVRDVEGFFATLHPEAAETGGSFETVGEAFKLLPEGELTAKRFYSELRWGTGEYQGVPVYVSAYDIEGGGKFAQLTLAVHPMDGACCVTSYINLVPSDRPPSAFNDFTFEGKGWVHYVMFGLLIIMPLFLIGVALLCSIEKRVRHRWAWVPFILVGMWGVTFNWTTGAIQPDFFNVSEQGVFFKFLSLHLFGAGFVTAGSFQPWILTIGSPIGAFAYLIRRRFHKPLPEPARPYETAA